MAFENVYITPRVRAALAKVLHPKQHARFWELVTKLQQERFDIPGLNVEKLHTRKGKLYSARMTLDMRVIFSVATDETGGARSLVIQEVNHHDNAYNRADRVQTATSRELVVAESIDDTESQSSLDDSDENTAALLFRVPHYVLADPDKYVSFESTMDRYLKLSDEQEELLSKLDYAYMVQGSAGTGKTTLALFYALNAYERNPDDNVFLFTYHDELACVCRSYKVNLTGDDCESEATDGGIHVFSYLDFCKQYLRSDPEQGWQWISREQSISALQRIIGGKSRWSRTYDAEEFYNLVYSILKGRFVPGTDRLPQDKEDYSRIFKDYGRVPSDLEEILDVFANYDKWLKRSKLHDEADLIRLSYNNQRNRCILASEEQAAWIVIDEIQDFTELEWKSIMLFWENQCKHSKANITFPFISGDINQNISRSGFRWQEIHAYIEGIFRNLHRPNSTVKVQLHSNYRNTREIYDLGVFLRSLATEPAADLGLPPQHHGAKPQVVIGSAQEFAAFADRLIGCAEWSGPPMVILSEDETSLPEMRRMLADNEAFFLLPVKSSKGMEFEDTILYRPFSSIQTCDIGEIETARLFDLWYMAATRARRSLLLYLLPEDLEGLKRLSGERYERFLDLIEQDNRTAAVTQLLNYHSKREQYLPNYNVIFLERKVAEDLWQEFQNHKSIASDKGATSSVGQIPTHRLLPHSTFSSIDPKLLELPELPIPDSETALPERAAAHSGSSTDARALRLDPDYAERCKARALKLWKRCHDYSRLGKAFFVLGLFEEAEPLLRRCGHFREAALCLEETGRFVDAAKMYLQCSQLEDAARCFEYAGDYQQAAGLYEQTENWVMAAETLGSAGEFDRAASACVKAGMFRSAADIYRLKGAYLQAAELYVQVEDFSTAGEMYLKGKDKLDAARCFLRADLFERAGTIFETLNRWSEAAEAFEKSGAGKRAAHLYGKAGRLADSARLLEVAGDVYGAARMHERARNWQRAASLFLTLKKKDRAAHCLQEAGSPADAALLFEELQQFEAAARCYEQSGDLATAADLFLKCDKFNDAGYCFERLNRFSESANAYLKSNNLSAAALVLARLGRTEDAARLYLLSSQAVKAVELVRSAGKASEASIISKLINWAIETEREVIHAEILEQTRSYLESARKFEQCVNYGRAAVNFEKATKFADAARCYMQDGKLEDAARCFKKANQWSKAAHCLEQLKHWEEACQLYERCNDAEGAARCRNAVNWL